MSFEDPRGSLPPSAISIHPLTLQPSRRSFPSLPKPKAKQFRPRKPPCCDWIFSSASNIHVAVDKYWFKTFTPFDTYVLTVAGQKQISVRGIGSVDLKIRCKPNNHQSRVITLDNVLYVPGWVCNIFSDSYFIPDPEANEMFEHKWTHHGVCFTKRTNGKTKPWGYTEDFCGLDRLILSRKPHGRSLMLEDPDREEEFRAKELQRLAKEHEAEILSQQRVGEKQRYTVSTELLIPKNNSPGVLNPNLKSASPVSQSNISVRSKSENNLAKVMAQQVSAASLDLQQAGVRMSLNEISSNRAITMRNDDGARVSSLKASFTAKRGLLKDFLVAQPEKD
ncbi:hypothetical protein LTR64_004672 [Lithohypha guttulata]|uniref:uncharacterized protein n=1 Tax=Lithohypha guttulata TaxID=1690604 RepID=UPI002DDE6CD1|nr:hypothetical protein LTR51_006031 [Lithohypha guttulata]